jgi:hypothetical protein
MDRRTVDHAPSLEAPVLPPPRCCDDCQLHLGRDVLLALATCPRWGMPRAGVKSHCSAFVRKEAL